MASSLSKTGVSEVADINITPMIDVLLVLLVIFIIVQMNIQRAFDIVLPRAEGGIRTDPIVLEILQDGVLHVNAQPVQPAALESLLRGLYAKRPDRVIYIRAAGEVPYGVVMQHIDAARAAGVAVVGAILPGTAPAAPRASREREDGSSATPDVSEREPGR